MTKTELLADLERLRRDHHVEEEDGFYSCPRSEDPHPSRKFEDCNCGARAHNARLNGLIQRVKETAWD